MINRILNPTPTIRGFLGERDRKTPFIYCTTIRAIEKALQGQRERERGRERAKQESVQQHQSIFHTLVTRARKRQERERERERESFI